MFLWNFYCCNWKKSYLYLVVKVILFSAFYLHPDQSYDSESLQQFIPKQTKVWDLMNILLLCLNWCLGRIFALRNTVQSQTTISRSCLLAKTKAKLSQYPGLRSNHFCKAGGKYSYENWYKNNKGIMTPRCQPWGYQNSEET